MELSPASCASGSSAAVPVAVGCSGTNSEGSGSISRRQEAPPARISVPPSPTKSFSAWIWARESAPLSNWSRMIALSPLRNAALVGKSWTDAKLETATSDRPKVVSGPVICWSACERSLRTPTVKLEREATQSTSRSR